MKHSNGFNSTWLGSNVLLKTLKNVKEFKQRNVPVTARFRKHNQCFETHCRFIFWLPIILSYWNGFNTTWLNITEQIPKNIEKCKRIQIKKRFHISVSARLRKRN